MHPFHEQTIPIPKRLMLSLGISILAGCILIWIPILGWIMIPFLPIFAIVLFFKLKTSKSGVCPYCESKITHELPHRSFKCGACKQRVIVGEREFRKV